MTDGTNNSIVNLGDLAKPADTLIKKVSSAVGGLFAPYQLRRIAKAEAEVAIIKAEADIKVTDLHRRAMHRFVEEEAQKQQNIEDITHKAIPHLSHDAQTDNVENDWIVNFFDKSRIVSNSDMQEIWARVLSGEANAPGSYSKRTVNFLAGLDKTDAEQFCKLCGFGWQIGTVVPLVFDVGDSVYTNHGVSFNSLTHLESIGLIKFDHLAGFRRLRLPRRFTVHYYGSPLELEMTKDSDNELNIGRALLTKIGQELAPICGSLPVSGFLDYVRDKWQVHLPKTLPEGDGPTDGSVAGLSAS